MDVGISRRPCGERRETVADSYYARSLAVGEYRGVVTAIPDIARHTLHINLSAGLEPVAAECLAKMSRLFDLQCNPQIVNGALGKLGAARRDCVYLVVLTLLSRACGRF